MSLVKKLSARLQNHPKRIVYSEGSDPRIIQSARQFATRKLGVPILVGNKEEIYATAKALDVRMDGIKVLQPELSDDYADLCKLLGALPKFKTFDSQAIADFVRNPNYYATLMLATGRADAMLSGATMSTSSALRPIFQIIQLQKSFKAASSMMLMEMEDSQMGINGDIFMGDCGVIPEPDEQQLCDIAITTALLVYHLTSQTPKVAMLSYVTKSATATLPSIMKIKAATALVHEKAKTLQSPVEVDGELQVDAALRPEVAELKGIKSSVAGHANVLIFPDLNSGNIASKMIQFTSGARCYGKIITGLTKPVAEISRGSTIDEIFGTSVLVAAQAVDRRFLSIEDA